MSTSQRGFFVAHQKVHVNVDIPSRSLGGWTELTVVPTQSDSRKLRLDARRMTIEKCLVNNIETSFKYRDISSESHQVPKSWDVHNYEMYAKKIAPLVSSNPEGPGELEISFPKNVKVTEPSESSFMGSNSSREKTYEPMTLRIYYHIRSDSPNEGLNFVNTNPKEPHVYTTHTPIGQATSCWSPCVDGLWSLSTWELEISVDQFSDKEDVDSEISVICNSVTPNEQPDPSDSHRKLVKFELFNPISSQHLGFAVGPFKSVPLVAVEEKSSETADNAEAAQNVNASANAQTQMGGANGAAAAAAAAASATGNSGTPALPITAYALPSKEPLVAITTRPLVFAMDYFTRDFGSFPYDSYSICFVGDFPNNSLDTADACALTICNDTLLFPGDVIEPRFDDCHHLVRGIAAQWCGVSIVPSSCNDSWVTEGIAMYLTNSFIRKLMGNNEYRFRIRKGNEESCREDIDRPPIGLPHFRFPLCTEDLQFIRLKAPLVLFILDRRMTKTDRSLGISRVLTKLFLQSMSGDLRSQLSTAHFVRQCEKVAHHRLTKFFNEWVFGSGFPIFRITQRFNKKRLCIEMGIGQVHSRESPQETLRDETVLGKAITHLDIVRHDIANSNSSEQETLRLMNEMPGIHDDDNKDSLSVSETFHFSPPTHFTGPMTIRIHEANGTPYEHVVDLREQLTKIDIPYNTKYKRLRRSQKFRKDVSNATANVNNDGDRSINCLGDVLMSEEEVSDWMSVDWGDGAEGDDEIMFNEAFEWLRADADFEWLGRFFVSQPDYMYASQLQQDQDVVAQYDAVRFFGRQQPNPSYYTVLTRTLMDPRYFYGVRVESAKQSTKNAVPELQFAGMHLSSRAFRELYCFNNSRSPRANNFSNVPSYFVQKAIPLALSHVRDPATGKCPHEISLFLLDLIRYNENSENPYSDTFYIANSLEAATYTQLPSGADGKTNVNSVWEDEQATKYLTDVVAEINKSQRLDRWVPSYRNIITTTSIKMEELLVEAGYGQPRMDKLLLSTQPDEPVEVRTASISSSLNLGGYHNKHIMTYLLETLSNDKSLSARDGVLDVLKRLVGHVAIHGEYEPATKSKSTIDPIVQRQQAIARQSVRTVIPSLRSSLGESKPSQNSSWKALQSPKIGSLDSRFLLEICEVLYEPTSRMMAVMKCPPLFELNFRRRRDYVIVAKYRSILKKKRPNPGQTHPAEHEAPARENEPPKIKLRLR